MVLEMLVRVLTSVGMWKTSRRVIDWLLCWDKAPTGKEGQKQMDEKSVISKKE